MAYEVTIGIPVYNVEKYIRMTLESALAQTFQDIEFLICDDCGTDASMDIVREYQQHHPRGRNIRIVRQPKNMGLGNARNRIIDEARGRYLYHLDADDAIAPNAIELLYRSAMEYDADMVYGSHRRIEEYDENMTTHDVCYPDMVFLEDGAFADYVYSNYKFLQANTWNFLIKKDIYTNNALLHQPVNFWEDFSITIDLPCYVTRVVLRSDITYYYYCRLGSLSHYGKRSTISRSEVDYTIGAMQTLKDRSRFLKQKPYFHKRMYKVMKTHFFMACAVMKADRSITPPLTHREIRNLMRSPLTFTETLRLPGWRFLNLSLYMLGVLPASISVGVIWLLGKMKHLL